MNDNSVLFKISKIYLGTRHVGRTTNVRTIWWAGGDWPQPSASPITRVSLPSEVRSGINDIKDLIEARPACEGC